MAKGRRQTANNADRMPSGDSGNGIEVDSVTVGEPTVTEAGAAIATADKPKKVRMAYYLVIGLNSQDEPVEVFKRARSQRGAEKWIIENRTLLARLTGQVVMVRARNVAVREQV